MQRRKVIQSLALLLCYAKARPAGLFTWAVPPEKVKEQRFLDPATIGIVMSIGKLFLGLFSSGPSVADLLANITKQLEIIDEKINIVLENLQIILEKLEQSPAANVRESLKNEIKANLDEYIAIITTINRPDLYKGNQEAFLAINDNRKRVNNLIELSHRAKLRLRQYSSAELVPYIALCMQMEYFLKAKLRKQKFKDFKVDLEQDQNWLVLNVFKLEKSVFNNLTRLKGERTDLIANTPSKFTVNLDNGAPIRRWYCFTVTCAYGITCTDAGESQEVKELGAVQILPPDFSSCSYQFLNSSNQLDIERTSYSRGNPPYDVYCTHATVTQNMASYIEGITRRKNEKSMTNYVELVKTAAEYYAGIQALEYCQNYLKIM